jgi:hypothetical protein
MRIRSSDYCLSALVLHSAAEWHHGGVAQITAAETSHEWENAVVALEQSRAARCRRKRVLPQMPGKRVTQAFDADCRMLRQQLSAIHGAVRTKAFLQHREVKGRRLRCFACVEFPSGC